MQYGLTFYVSSAQNVLYIYLSSLHNLLLEE